MLKQAFVWTRSLVVSLSVSVSVSLSLSLSVLWVATVAVQA